MLWSRLMTAVTATDDIALLRRYAERGDQAAFSEIIRRYAGVVFAACHRVLGDASRAEDVSQETFFRLMRRPEAVSQSLGAWLHTAATNLAVDAIRSEAARRRREHEYAADSLEERLEAEAEVSSWAELSPHVDEAMAELPEDDRALLVAHFLRGIPQNELAAEAKTSAATMCRRIRAAVEALQRKLRNRGLGVAPLALAGFMHDHALTGVPASLGQELAKMSLLSNTRGLLRPLTADHAPLLWTAAAIIAVSVTVGAIFAMIGGRGLPRHAPTPAPQFVVAHQFVDR
jgi:RNA polymerase sigma-70 factor (ECF subfamily)